MKTRHPNVTVNPDRHGKLRARYRKAGVKPVYMKHLPGEPGFDAEYKGLCEGTGATSSAERAIPGSVDVLCARYYRSADFLRSGDADQKRRRGIIESFRAEFGNDQVSDFTFEHVELILIRRSEKRQNAQGRWIGGQVAAVTLRKQMRRLFAYARKIKMISDNPVEEAEKVGKTRISGFHTWTEEEIAQYQKHHPYGTKARLAMEIMLWSGQRKSDARLFGPKHIVDAKINYSTGKTGVNLWMPIARDLRRAIDAMPAVGVTTYLVTDYGNPFSPHGFGNKMREWCNAAGLPQCSSHGLRKALARRMAQMQLSDEQMMAVGGWKQSQQLRTYTEAVEQESLADSAIRSVDGRYSTDKS